MLRGHVGHSGQQAPWLVLCVPLKPSAMPSEQAAKLLRCFYNTDAPGLLVGNF